LFLNKKEAGKKRRKKRERVKDGYNLEKGKKKKKK